MSSPVLASSFFFLSLFFYHLPVWPFVPKHFLDFVKNPVPVEEREGRRLTVSKQI